MVDLQTLDSLASIGTALFAVGAYWRYRWEKGRIRRAIEEYLDEERKMGGDMGRRSITNIVVALGVPAQNVLEAAFDSIHIERHATTKANGTADEVMLRYKG